MKTTIAICIDGVLRNLNGGKLIIEGKELFHAIAPAYRIILLSEGIDQAKEEYWLTMNGFKDHSELITARVEDLNKESDELVLYQVNSLLGRGYLVMFTATADPTVAASLLAGGHRVFGVYQPPYLVPEWQPGTGKGKQSWDALKTSLMKQQILKAADKRLDEDPR